MARIRTIKPDFWEDETVAALQPLARLLFVGTWNFADDEGILRWSPDYINASLFMYDDLPVKKVAGLMAELVTHQLVFVYVGGKTRQTLAYIPNFLKHQRINRPQPSKFPPPSLQNPATIDMYAERDGWVCHLCHGPINRTYEGFVDEYDARETARPSLNMSPDHVVPRCHGGTDYPSNIRASHISCNKRRGAKPLPGSVNDSLNDSCDPPESFTPGMEVEGNGSGREGDNQSSSNLNGRDESPVENEEEEDPRVGEALGLLTDRRWAGRQGPPVNDPPAWRRRTLANVRADYADALRALCVNGTTPEAMAEKVEPRGRSEGLAAVTSTLAPRRWVEDEETGRGRWEDDAMGVMG